MTAAKSTAREYLDTQLAADVVKALGSVGVVAPNEVIDLIVKEVRGGLEKHHLAGDEDSRIYQEVKNLAQYIRQMKQEIVSVQPGDVNTTHLRAAKNELDAVIGATEEAANKIMDVADEISVYARELGSDIQQKLTGYTTRIFEASNFQDITGQRITKVVKALKYIDARVDILLKILNGEMSAEHATGVDLEDPLHVADPLINGPQLPGHEMNQDSIDQLMGGE